MGILRIFGEKNLGISGNATILNYANLAVWRRTDVRIPTIPLGYMWVEMEHAPSCKSSR